MVEFRKGKTCRETLPEMYSSWTCIKKFVKSVTLEQHCTMAQGLLRSNGKTSDASLSSGGGVQAYGNLPRLV